MEKFERGRYARVVLVIGVLVLCVGFGWLGNGLAKGGNDRWEVHEWGTFTSMMGSNGRLLEGMHHEEEHLPRFVHNRARHGMVAFKGNPVGQPPSRVTQKLETPVIYFYTDKPRKVEVKVDFPKGVISEWYPNAVKFSPPLAYSKREGWVPKGGSMTWAGIAKPGPATFPYVVPTSIWMPSRQVPDAAPFHASTKRFGRTLKQSERFIFYRGLGSFRGWLRVSDNDPKRERWQLSNLSPQSIPGGIVMHVTAQGGSWRAFGAVPGNAKRSVLAPGKPKHVSVFLTEVKQHLVKLLIASGLTKDESWSMVHTWHRSYFKTLGTRVLYIVPRAWTDALLPISIKPRPKKLVRTLVGRVELLTRREEQALVTRIKSAYRMKMNFRELQSGRWRNARYFAPIGRLAEPKLRRACQLLKGGMVKSYCEYQVRVARYKR